MDDNKYCYVDKVFKKALDFKGRARRKEYWCFALFSFLIYIIIAIISVNFMNDTGAILSLIFNLIILIPSISVTTRRLHDVNMSGWWQLLYLIPLIGPLILLFFFIKEGDKGENRFGENPIKEENLETSN